MPKSIEDMINDRYKHPEVREAILADIRQRGDEHEQKILSGELTLPSEYDAERHVSGVSHWESADRHAKSDSKAYGVGPNPVEHAKALARLQQLKEGA